jgi:hypothetical protein
LISQQNLQFKEQGTNVCPQPLERSLESKKVLPESRVRQDNPVVTETIVTAHASLMKE